MEMFDFLKHLLDTDDSKILFILTLIGIAMIIDFVSGVIGAYINPDIEFRSKVGINGILRKIASLILLVFFIPISVLIPSGVGTAVLYTLYIGYLLMELRSIFENYKKMGVKTEIFEEVVDKITIEKSNDEETKGKRE